MKVFITGANGFLGYHLTRQLLEKGFLVIASSKGECRLPFAGHKNFVYVQMDFTDPFDVNDVFEKYQPPIVVHAGAMSRPDDCELNQWQAYVVNVEGTLNVLMNAEEQKAFFILVSTDFVFDGENGGYKEDDERKPVNFYGRTKLLAEEAVQEYPFDWAIIRTALVFGNNPSGRNNIVTLVREKLEKNEAYKVFTDQRRTPTYVEDLAKGIVAVIERNARGIFHIAGKDILSPYEIACATAEYLKLNAALIQPIVEFDLTQPARRPPKTNLVIEKARKELDYDPLGFAEGLKKMFE